VALYASLWHYTDRLGARMRYGSINYDAAILTLSRMVVYTDKAIYRVSTCDTGAY